MATAKKLKSGSYRCLVYDYTDNNGKRIYRSFTAATKKEAEYLASVYKMEVNNNTFDSSLSIATATQKYIENRLSILSPTTLRTYKGILRNQIQLIGHIRVNKITQDDIQIFINSISGSLSPKTIRNIHGLLHAVISTYRPGFSLRTDLPQKIQPNLYIPSEEEVRHLIRFAKGSEMEVPILLAALGPMRRGEISALDASDVDGNLVHVRYSLARDDEGNWIRKQAKTQASDRYIEYPDFVIALLPKQGRITQLHPNKITNRFEDLLKKAGLKHFRFHDLRHYSASILHAMGIPDKYIMERGGWATGHTLKTVYQHTIRGKNKEINSKINNYFSTMQHEMQHN